MKPISSGRVVAACAGLAMLAGSAAARADVNDRGLYIGFRALPAVSAADDEAVVGGAPGGRFRQRGDDPELNIGAGATLGYYWQGHGVPIRTELEYFHRLRLDFDAREDGPPTTGYRDDVSNDSVMFNVYFDFDTRTSWWPYVGVGIGWARNSSDSVRTNILTGVKEGRDEASNNFAYGFQAGVRVAISRAWVGEFGYRYINMGEIDTGRFTTGDRVIADDFVSHDIVLGIVYMF